MNQIIVCSAERIDHVYNANYDYITNFCLIKDSCKRYDIYKDCPDDFGKYKANRVFLRTPFEKNCVTCKKFIKLENN